MKRFLVIALSLVVPGMSAFACSDLDDAAAWSVNNTNNSGVEICDNGLDDDGDGDVDCEDSDCDCPEPYRHVTIIGTADISGAVMGCGPSYDYSPETTGDDATMGGLDRIATLITQVRDEAGAAGRSTVLVDSGGFLVGDILEILPGTAPPILHFFRYMAYDTVTLGDRDFEWGPGDTARYITAAREL